MVVGLHVGLAHFIVADPK